MTELRNLEKCALKTLYIAIKRNNSSEDNRPINMSYLASPSHSHSANHDHGDT